MAEPERAGLRFGREGRKSVMLDVDASVWGKPRGGGRVWFLVVVVLLALVLVREKEEG